MFKYLKDIFTGIISLCEGLWVTLKHCFRPRATLQYPEERPELSLRFRGRLVMPIDPEKGAHRCTACMLCVKACPNRSIELIEKEVGEDGKPKPKACKYVYNLGTCMFCNLCVEACSFGAIVMSDEYENATMDKKSLTMDLVAEKYVIKGKKEKWWISKFKELD